MKFIETNPCIFFPLISELSDYCTLALTHNETLLDYYSFGLHIDLVAIINCIMKSNLCERKLCRRRNSITVTIKLIREKAYILLVLLFSKSQVVNFSKIQSSLFIFKKTKQA